MTLDDKVNRIAINMFPSQNSYGAIQREKIRDAIYAGIRAFAEQEPTKEMQTAFRRWYNDHGQALEVAYKAMMAESLKALD